MKYELEYSLIKKKVTFMQGLCLVWKLILPTVKTDEQLKSYQLSQVVGILISHEDEVTEGAMLTVDAGPLALATMEEVAKVKKSKEKVILVTDSGYDCNFPISQPIFYF